MDMKYFFSAFGTFGNPNGFRQSFFLGGDPAIAKSLKTFDLKTDAIQLFPGSRLYGMRKEKIGDTNVISYCIYTFAKEHSSHRAGTFIGSGLVFADKIASENLTIALLNEFHHDLEKRNIVDDTIKINHSDRFSVSKPKDFDKVGFHGKEIDELYSLKNTGGYLMVYTETHPSQLQSLFRRSLDLLHTYEMIYFTQSYDVAEFVKQKGIFKIIDIHGFEGEIQKLEAERSQIITNTMNEFEREAHSLIEDRRKLVNEINSKIEQNKKRHLENEQKIKESENGVEIINKEYDEYSVRIQELMKSLSSGEKPEKVRRLYDDYKKSLHSKISQNRNIHSLHSVSSAHSGHDWGQKTASPFGGNFADFSKSSSNIRKKESKIDVYKITTFVLSFLIISALVFCFMFFTDGKIKIPEF